MRCGGSCGYDSDVLATPSIDNHEQTACRTHAECHKSPFVRLRFIIRDSDGVGIVKRRNRLRHPDAVLPKIETGFALLVPLETHPFSVRTYCAYVKRVTETRSTTTGLFLSGDANWYSERPSAPFPRPRRLRFPNQCFVRRWRVRIAAAVTPLQCPDLQSPKVFSKTSHTQS